MRPAQHTFHARAGDTFEVPLVMLQGDGVTPVDLTGASVEWSLWSGSRSEQWIDTAQASIDASPATGRVWLRLTLAEVRAMVGGWSFELTLGFASGRRQTPLVGMFLAGAEGVV